MSPAFFPDHHKIVFTRVILSNQDLFKMTVNDAGDIIAGPTKLTTSPRDDFNPTVSADGKKIAFVSNRGAGSDYDIYVMKPAPESRTNKPVKLTKSTADDFSPEWSPGGTKIAFESDRPDAQGTTDFEIYVMRPVPESSTNQPQRLTKNSAEDTQPAFSPDGRKLALVSNRTGLNLDIFKMRADGSGAQVNITNSAGNQDSPSWQPDP